MRLVLSTPTRLVVDVPARRVRAEDATGSFCVLPGHTGFVTALEVSVLEWTHADGAVRYAAVREGVLRVAGEQVAVATREAVLGDDLEQLEREVLADMRRAQRAEREARHAQIRFELGALRLLYRYLGPAWGDDLDALGGRR